MADDQKHALSSAIRHEEDVVDPTKAKADHEKNQGDEDVDPAIARYSPAEQRKILQRVDFRILPIVCALYFISLMDRTNCALFCPRPHHLKNWIVCFVLRPLD